MNHRNMAFIQEYSANYYDKAINESLMQVTIQDRKGKTVTMPDGSKAIEFINCSYLGLDLHPAVIKASKTLDENWGVNFCCARSRFSIEPARILEEELSLLFGGRAITFPSVTTTHISVLPLIASGALLGKKNRQKVKIIFDKFAHASMQFLKPILASEATVTSIPHNDLNALHKEIVAGKNNGETCVYVADGVYSMGGLCPIAELLKMSETLDFYLYIDDAHGTSIFGEYGEGTVLSHVKRRVPENLFVTFCLSKGFGCNGGGIILPSSIEERLVRTYGLIYAFSAALDFSVTNACLAALELHKNGDVRKLQSQLRNNVNLYDTLTGLKLPFSPIRMIEVGEEDEAIALCKELLFEGFFVSVVFFPIVPRKKAQLRVCIAANHSEEEIRSLVSTLQNISSIKQNQTLQLAAAV